METYKRVCLEDLTLMDEDDKTFTLRRGQEYLTSREKDGRVVVFSTYWVSVPASLFAGVRKCSWK